MKISVIVPCIDSDFERALISLQRLVEYSTLFPTEIVFVISETKRLLEDVQNALESATNHCVEIKCFMRTAHAYAGNNRNFGAQRATGDLLVFHDADDEMHAQKLEIIAHLFSKYKNLDVLIHLQQPFGFKWEVYNDFDEIELVAESEVKNNGFEPKNWGKFGGMHCGHVTIQRKVFESIQFDPLMAKGQDRDFLQKALRQNYHCRILRAFLCKYDGLKNPNCVARRMREWKTVDEPRGLGTNRTKKSW